MKELEEYDYNDYRCTKVYTEPSRKREAELLERAKTNDKEAIEELLTGYKGTVIEFAQRAMKYTQTLELEDLLQEGYTYLYLAIQSYANKGEDKYKGIKFKIAARNRIAQGIALAIASADEQNRGKRQECREYIMCQLLGYNSKVKYKIEKTEKISIEEIEERVREGEEELDRIDYETSEYSLLDKEYADELAQKALNAKKLTDNERKLITHYFGFGDDEARNISQTARQFGYSRQYFHETKPVIIEKMKNDPSVKMFDCSDEEYKKIKRKRKIIKMALERLELQKILREQQENGESLANEQSSDQIKLTFNKKN